MKVRCLTCGYNATVGDQIAGRLLTPAAAAIFGAKALKNPWAVAALTIAAFWLGSKIDSEINKRCPQCGAILTVVEPLL